jgi:hypothetical protein
VTTEKTEGGGRTCFVRFTEIFQLILYLEFDVFHHGVILLFLGFILVAIAFVGKVFALESHDFVAVPLVVFDLVA